MRRSSRTVAFAGMMSVLLVTTFTLVLLTTLDGSIDVNARSLDAFLAWTTYALALVTAGLLVAAIVAGRRIGQQIAEGREQHEQQIAALTRPAINVSSASLEDRGVMVTIKNIGVGPAFGITVTAWLLPMDEVEPSRYDAAETVVGRAGDLNLQRHEYAGEAGALGAGGGEDLLLELTKWAQRHDTGLLTRYSVLMWEATCQDVFEHARPGSGWLIANPKPGSQIFV